MNSERSSLSEEEVFKIEYDSKIALLRRENLRNDELESVIALRKLYANRIMYFAIGWSIATFILIILNGQNYIHFNLNSSVLNTVITISLGNVFALVVVVAKGIFPINSKT
ncbi:hypothetical protein [Bacteriovorax sp. BSW11_IV]|uniref:hypothetical protein n=1 Tax=Bacteriovorax sp. BSW11_IV TaxID=1353529 RepID=UPI0012DD6FE7|nr:hypothetical protein [Bacteriovorax sp. BSW11_IV]